ncbi:MAG: DUF1289 domain-containing protein [Proteobacteria bacterium]|nr:DUF1289 domain-containing protein [Pseudomonadota bacterium]
MKNVIGRIPSPCVRNCCLDENDICLGCSRFITEIAGWKDATEREQREILIRCCIRNRQRHDKVLEHFDQTTNAPLNGGE